jgi:hypothetical protein
MAESELVEYVARFEGKGIEPWCFLERDDTTALAKVMALVAARRASQGLFLKSLRRGNKLLYPKKVRLPARRDGVRT